MFLDFRAIHIYTDGSCYKNPGGSSGCAAVVHYPDHLNLPDETIVDFGCAESSNNRMELMAGIKALKWVRQYEPWESVTRALIISDSTYVTSNVALATTWKSQGWRNRHGQPIANHDLWNDLLLARAKVRIRVDFVWQAGKISPIAKVVDKAAKAAARRAGIDVDRGYRPGGVSRSMVKGGIAAQYPANGQVGVIRPYQKKIMFLRENRISFNLFNESQQDYEGKFFAYAPTELAGLLHMRHGYRVRFNRNPKYAQILDCLEEVQLPVPTRSRKKKVP